MLEPFHEETYNKWTEKAERLALTYTPEEGPLRCVTTFLALESLFLYIIICLTFVKHITGDDDGCGYFRAPPLILLDTTGVQSDIIIIILFNFHNLVC